MLQMQDKISVTLLEDAGPLKAGETHDATVWHNTDSGEPCAEIRVSGITDPVPLGQLRWGGWQYAAN